jgi:uncharacterized protein (TIGR02118 family)
MVKMFYLFKRRTDVSPDEFHECWRDKHGPLFCNSSVAQRYVLRYEQNHAPPENVGMSDDEFDGISVMWFHSVEDVHAMRAGPEYQDVVVADGGKFIDLPATKVMMSFAEEPFDIPVNTP